MASTAELSLSFRVENAIQSYMTYITRMFWPGKMSVLYLLDVEHVNHYYTAFALIGLALISLLVLWGTLCGKRYLAFGWFWYVGTLVPVIGIVQVGEQTHANRYTYIPYVGLFIILAWGIADLIALLPDLRRPFQLAAGCVMGLALVTCVGWTRYQLQFWTGVEVHLRHALTITPDNWNMLNNLGVYLWKQAQEQDVKAGRAEVEGKPEEAKAFHEKSVELKKDAKAQWIHGITARPTATDIHSNLGYAYSEANDLDKAEWHLNKAVELKPISPRPRNNLGRVLLRRSQQCEADARAAEAKGKTDPAEAAKAAQLKETAKVKLKAAIEQFEEAVKLDPTLLEARLNLGEVYLSLWERDRANNPANAEANLANAENHYQEIIKLKSPSIKDRETINNFGQAYYGLARLAVARKRSDDVVNNLLLSLECNPQNTAALQMLATQRFQRGEFREGEKCLWPLLIVIRKEDRSKLADQFAGQLEATGQAKAAIRAYNFLGWVFSTSPEPQLLDPQRAFAYAKHAVELTRKQDPFSLDTAAAAQAACGQFGAAVQTAHDAISLANAQGKKALADAISARLPFYQQNRPYRCDPKGGDRPESLQPEAQ